MYEQRIGETTNEGASHEHARFRTVLMAAGLLLHDLGGAEITEPAIWQASKLTLRGSDMCSSQERCGFSMTASHASRRRCQRGMPDHSSSRQD
jgi:hypothetical protein